MSRKLEIAIATAGRFHVLNLACELHAIGHHVKFYSCLPTARVCKFGLPKECHVSLLPFAAPVLAWNHAASWLAPHIRERILNAILDRAVMMRLAPCDVFICMSGIYLEAAREAKRRYDAKIWLERGSRHILSQDAILSANPSAERPTPLSIRRELAGYALADKIVVPSVHVEESFRDDEAAYAKLFRNPYGVDLKMFPQKPKGRPSQPFTLLYVGLWSLRKGCDVLGVAVERTSGVRLLHVGGIGDLRFPQNDARFIHVDPVQQWDLQKFYAAGDAFVLASREEGLSVVLAQALASGLPVICTEYTGGADLGHTPALAARITVVSNGDADALAYAIAQLRDREGGCEDRLRLSESDRGSLSWTAYGKRYHDELVRSFEAA